MSTGVIMIVLMILWTSCVVHLVQAAPCTDYQHCSDCDPKTGHCLNRCDDGYFDKRCSTMCSAGCNKKLCEIDTNTGAEICSEGCKPGYYGLKCNIQCIPSGRTCTQCQNGCDQAYCNIGSVCFSGCYDSYYGSYCKNCSSRCNSCNMVTGTCKECQQSYVGPNCEQSSKNCKIPHNNECTAGCKPGFYGPYCVNVCNDNCRPNPDISTQVCLSVDTHHSYNCTPHCHRNTGDCTSGCRKGWYGPQCTFHCNPHCRHSKTYTTNSTMEGCVSAHLDEECTPWSESLQCQSRNGSCLNGCISGYYGEMCNHTCETCLGGMCDQENGSCVNGCQTNYSGERCEYNCTQNCSKEHCITTEICVYQRMSSQAKPGRSNKATTEQSISHSEGDRYYIVIIAILATFLLVCLVTAVGYFIFCRQGIRVTRTVNEDVIRSQQSTVGPGRVDTPSAMYESLHTYCEIDGEYVGQNCATSREESKEAVIVLADVFKQPEDMECGTSEDSC